MGDLRASAEPRRDGVEGSQGEASAVVAVGLRRVYRMGDVEVPALNGIDLGVARGEFVAIIGASGSGKSTLLNLMGLMDVPTDGSLFIDGVETSRLSSDERAEVRLRKIGFVFQFFNLFLELSALENVMLPSMLAGDRSTATSARALKLLERVGLAERARHKPAQLSGGQQQRVSIARALVNRPALLLADEPTANLDSKSAEEILKLLIELNHRAGQTIVLVTHETEYAVMAQRRIALRDGIVVADAGTTE